MSALHCIIYERINCYRRICPIETEGVHNCGWEIDSQWWWGWGVDRSAIQFVEENFRKLSWRTSVRLDLYSATRQKFSSGILSCGLQPAYSPLNPNTISSYAIIGEVNGRSGPWQLPTIEVAGPLLRWPVHCSVLPYGQARAFFRMDSAKDRGQRSCQTRSKRKWKWWPATVALGTIEVAIFPPLLYYRPHPDALLRHSMNTNAEVKICRSLWTRSRSMQFIVTFCLRSSAALIFSPIQLGDEVSRRWSDEIRKGNECFQEIALISIQYINPTGLYAIMREKVFCSCKVFWSAPRRA